MKRSLGALALAVGVWVSVGPPIAAQAPYVFQLGFASLRDAVGLQIVGDALENERAIPVTGNAEQRTSKGLLVWRKADNWTAFTDGHTTWINGPYGLVSRLNTQRYPWESDYLAPGTVPLPGPNFSSARTPEERGPDWWSVAFVRAQRIASTRVESSTGGVQTRFPTGQFLNVHFTVRNQLSASQPITRGAVALLNDQGRVYNPDFQLVQVNPDGSVSAFDGYGVAPGTTVELRLTFDVATDATGLVLSVTMGNPVRVALPS